ncbi:Sulfotransferase domain [Dillenia turbinata]|uniref:Sulfotransferase n=1 Tax=Dillenia turbinata TaxID=194707 RepID=A0AAN8Z3J6_9MAGN
MMKMMMGYKKQQCFSFQMQPYLVFPPKIWKTPMLVKISALQKVYDNEEQTQNPSSYYKEIISEFPTRENRWSGVWYDYCQFQGFWHHSFLIERIISLREHFVAKPSNIFMASSPKSGTTRLMALAFAIMTRTQFDNSNSPLLTTMPHHCVPLLEGIPIDPLQNPNANLLFTHIPYVSLPKSILHTDSKIIYICREPKDVFVSLWLSHANIEKRIWLLLVSKKHWDSFVKELLSNDPIGTTFWGIGVQAWSILKKFRS